MVLPVLLEEELDSRKTDTEFVSFRVSADVKEPFRHACIVAGTNTTRELTTYMRQFARENGTAKLGTGPDRLTFDDLDDEQIRMVRVALATIRNPKPINLAMLAIRKTLEVSAAHFDDFMSPSSVIPD